MCSTTYIYLYFWIKLLTDFLLLPTLMILFVKLGRWRDKCQWFNIWRVNFPPMYGECMALEEVRWACLPDGWSPDSEESGALVFVGREVRHERQMGDLHGSPAELEHHDERGVVDHLSPVVAATAPNARCEDEREAQYHT